MGLEDFFVLERGQLQAAAKDPEAAMGLARLLLANLNDAELLGLLAACNGIQETAAAIQARGN